MDQAMKEKFNRIKDKLCDLFEEEGLDGWDVILLLETLKLVQFRIQYDSMKRSRGPLKISPEDAAKYAGQTRKPTQAKKAIGGAS